MINRKRDILTTVIFGVAFLAGLSVMLYPTVSNWWNTNLASHSISGYKEELAQMDTSDYDRMLAEAQDYNERLAQLHAPFTEFEQVEGYEDP